MYRNRHQTWLGRMAVLCVPIPEPLRPYIAAAIKLSPSKWVFPAADGTQRAPDTNLKAVLQRALGRAGIVDGYEHRCRKPGCGHVELTSDDGNRRCPKDNRALWIRPLPKKGIVFHSLRHTTATLLARAKVHPSVAQKILRTRTSRRPSPSTRTSRASRTCAPPSRSSTSARSRSARRRLSSRSEKTRPLLPICYQ